MRIRLSPSSSGMVPGGRRLPGRARRAETGSAGRRESTCRLRKNTTRMRTVLAAAANLLVATVPCLPQRPASAWIAVLDLKVIKWAPGRH